MNFKRDFFLDEKSLDRFTSSCDVIVHLAGINRHKDEDFLLKIRVDHPCEEYQEAGLASENTGCHKGLQIKFINKYPSRAIRV